LPIPERNTDGATIAERRRDRQRGCAMSDAQARLARWEDVPREELTPRLGRRVITAERMMLAQIYLEEGAVVPKHSHDNEQLTYVLEGRLRFWLGDEGTEVVDVGAGEVLVIPSWVPHRVVALERTLDVDVFSPPRQDWLDGSDSYLREQ
jgi:quercetin dioxygenase-like cupin family protein